MKTILINAVAFTEGGSFVILEDLLKHIQYKNNFKYIVFCSVDNFSFKLPQNITIVNPRAKTWGRRLWWDFYGLMKWCSENNIKPSLLFSVQSCGSRFFKQIPQIIYYHQPMPIYNYKWNVFDKTERVLWLKKNILKQIIKLYIRPSTIIIVQLKIIKALVTQTFNIKNENVKVFYPSVPGDMDRAFLKNNITNENSTFSIIYPSSQMSYKNHVEIINAINYLKENKYNINELKVVFTLRPKDASNLIELIESFNLKGNFVFIGYVDRKKMLEIYEQADLLLFPSYIESFGLPLVEAAKFGIPIGALDLEYAHEVLAKYEGVTYLPRNNPEKWGKYIALVKENKFRYKPIDSKIFSPSWHELISFVESQVI